MKKQYISPEAEVFVCKINGMLMASGDLGAPEAIEEIIPSPEPPSDDVFNGREFDW
jgi:hypothetical protein